MQRTLEQKKQLLSDTIKSRTINNGDIPDLQDSIVMRTKEEIKEYYNSLSEREDKRSFIWICFKVLDIDTAMDIVKYTAIQNLLDEERKENDEEIIMQYDKLNAKIGKFQRQRQKVIKYNRELRSRIKYVNLALLKSENDLADARKENAKLYYESKELRETNYELEQIREALRLINSIK